MKKFISLLLILVYFIAFRQIVSAQSGHIIIPSGHANRIQKILLDKQSKYLYSMESGKVIMWDFKTHDQLYSFPNNFQEEISLSNDGTKLLIGVYCYSTVTGKFLFQVKGYSPVFSSDDNNIFSFESNKVCMTNVATREQTFISEYLRFGISENFMVDKDHFLITGRDGWILYNVTERKKEQQAENIIFYAPGLHATAAREKPDSIFIRDIFSGALIGKIKAKSATFKFYPAANSQDFIIDQNTDYINTEWTIYDGKTMTAIKKFTHTEHNGSILFFDKSSKVYASSSEDIVIIDTKKNTITDRFKRQVAKIGQATYSQLEYNYNTNMLNLITDDSIYKSVDMVHLKTVRQQVLPEFHTVAFSPTGDSVALFDYDNKRIIKNLVTSKQLIPALKLADEASGTEAKNFFFDKSGTHAYYTLFNVPRQLNTLYRVNLTTGKTESMVTFRSTNWPLLHPDKDILAAFDEGYQYSHAKVWDVTTGQLLFDKDMHDEDCRYINVSRDKKEVMIVTTKAIEKFTIANAALMASSQNTLFSNYDNYAGTPDLSALFASDVYGNLIAQKADGTKMYEVKLHDAAITNKFFSQDGSLIYTISEDQSIKVSYTASGTLLGTLFLFNDGKDYVFITPDGRFDGSDGGMQRMYYFQDRIKLPLASVYEKYFTPNLYQRLLAGETFDVVPDITFKPKPQTKIIYAEKPRNLEVEDDIALYANTTGIAEITVTATAPEDKVDEIRLFHNGKVINLATRGLFVTDNDGNDTKKYTITLLPGINNFRAVALNSQRTESDADEIEVSYSTGSDNKPAPPVKDNMNSAIISPVDKNATLHLVVVGINAYKNPKLSLNYALADATAFKDEVEKDAKTIIGTIKTYFITDDDADKTSITKALEQVQLNARSQDVFMFYYAGHGVIAGDKEFYLVPNDVTDLKNVDEALKEHGIAAKELQQYAINIQAQKQLFILDACQSAAAFADMLSRDGNQQKNIALVARATGTHWMAASGAQQFANEFSSLGHGAFTYVLLQALRGEAANNKMITVNGLKSFMEIRVPALMKKYNGTQQVPASYGFGNDFPVEVIN